VLRRLFEPAGRCGSSALRHCITCATRSDDRISTASSWEQCDSLEDLRRLANELHLNGTVNLTGYVSDEELEANLAAADICVDPDPSSPLNDVSTWIKIMEYMAYSKPIVSFDLKETRFSAQDGALFVSANDERAFAKGIIELMDNPLLRIKMGRAG